MNALFFFLMEQEISINWILFKINSLKEGI